MKGLRITHEKKTFTIKTNLIICYLTWYLTNSLRRYLIVNMIGFAFHFYDIFRAFRRHIGQNFGS